MIGTLFMYIYMVGTSVVVKKSMQIVL